jgi:hypothetical protein
MSELTTASAWIAGLAIVALIATGWRKPARATAVFVRAGRRSRGRPPIHVAETPVPLQRRPSLWRKIWAMSASGGLAVVTGAVIATVVSAGIAYTVITLTDMLRK